MLSLIFVAKLILVVILVSILLSFVLAPVVDFLVRSQVPRAVASLRCRHRCWSPSLGSATYVSYSRALDFTHEVPKYKAHIQAHRRQRFASRPKRSKRPPKTVVPIRRATRSRHRQAVEHSWTDMLSRNASSVSELVLALTFIPFLVFSC